LRVRIGGWTEVPWALVKHDLNSRQFLLQRLMKDLVFTTGDTREFTGSSKDHREKVVLFENDEDGHGATGCFRIPRYYLERIEDLLEPGVTSGIPPNDFEDRRAGGCLAPFPEFKGQLRQEPGKDQVAGSAALQDTMGGILVAAPGKGKCHPRGTVVLMWDGVLKNVEDIVVGDRLMGPDSEPRTVLSVSRGFGPLYQVTPKKGEPWGCNAEHVLSLKSSRKFPGETAKLPFCGFPEVWDVPLNEFVQRKEYAKHHWKLWRTGVEFFKGSSHGRPILDPYFLGVLLGDGGLGSFPGHSRSVTVTTMDPEIVEVIQQQARLHGLPEPREEVQEGNQSITYYLTNRGQVGGNPLRNVLDQLGVLELICEEKRVPLWYKTASREVRLEVLAGLLDTDGALNYEGYDFCVKSRQLAEDAAFLSRSLGLGSSFSKPREVDGVVYHRLRIYGDCSVIPIRIPRKKAQQRRQKKDVLVTGFEVEAIGNGEYFGFMLKEDPHYLLGDFTVTHNTVMAIHAACEIRRRTLVVVPTEALMDQWVKRIETFTTLTRGEIGIVQGDTCQWNRPFIVGMVHSLAQRNNYPSALYASVGNIITDEVHRIGAPTWLQVIPRFSAMYRWGLSATPERQDGMHRAFMLHIGDIVYEMTELDSQPTVYQILTGVQLEQRAISNPWNGQLNFSRMYTVLARDNRRNNLLAQEVKNCWKAGRKVLILSKRIQHLAALYHLSLQKGVPAEIMGTIAGPEKKKGDRVHILTSRKIIFAIEQIAGLGLDQPDLDTLIYGLPSQAVEQTIGRIERVEVEKKDPLVLDPVDDVPMLRRLAKARLKKFHSRGYKVLVVDKKGYGK
jgi:hypothetical protein